MKFPESIRLISRPPGFIAWLPLVVILFCSACILVRLLRSVDERPIPTESQFAELTAWAEHSASSFSRRSCNHKELSTDLQETFGEEIAMICVNSVGVVSHIFVDDYVYIPVMEPDALYVDGYTIGCFDTISSTWFRCRTSRS